MSGKPSDRCVAKKCMRPGRITNNGYLNFLRLFKQRAANCGLSPQETVRRAARDWCTLSAKQKNCYKVCGAPCCMRPGPVTKNGYLNFLREFRQKPDNCGLSPQETVRLGAQEWSCLTQQEKDYYKAMGDKSCSKPRRPACKPKCKPTCKPKCRPKRKPKCKPRCG